MGTRAHEHYRLAKRSASLLVWLLALSQQVCSTQLLTIVLSEAIEAYKLDRPRTCGAMVSSPLIAFTCEQQVFYGLFRKLLNESSVDRSAPPGPKHLLLVLSVHLRTTSC